MHIVSTNFAKTLDWKREFNIAVWRHKQRIPSNNDRQTPLVKLRIFKVGHREKYVERVPRPTTPGCANMLPVAKATKVLSNSHFPISYLFTLFSFLYYYCKNQQETTKGNLVAKGADLNLFPI